MPRGKDLHSAKSVAGVTRLYRHALESIFAFLPPADLSRVLSVNRSWSAGVHSMKPINVAVIEHVRDLKLIQAGMGKPQRPCVLVAASPLARHVSQFGCSGKAGIQRPELTSSDLFILSRHLGSLTVLSCSVALPQPSRLFFGCTLLSLDCYLEAEAQDAGAVSDAIVTISRQTSHLDCPSAIPL